MTKDDIKQALFMVARGQPNHPACEALVDALAELLRKPDPVAAAEPDPVAAAEPDPAGHRRRGALGGLLRGLGRRS